MPGGPNANPPSPPGGAKANPASPPTGARMALASSVTTPPSAVPMGPRPPASEVVAVGPPASATTPIGEPASGPSRSPASGPVGRPASGPIGRPASGLGGWGTVALCARSLTLTSAAAKEAKSGPAPASAFRAPPGAEASGVVVPLLGVGVALTGPGDDDSESSVVRNPHDDATSTATVHRPRWDLELRNAGMSLLLEGLPGC